MGGETAPAADTPKTDFKFKLCLTIELFLCSNLLEEGKERKQDWVLLRTCRSRQARRIAENI